MKIFFQILTFFLGFGTQLSAQESEIFIIEVTQGLYPNEIGWEVSELLTGDVIFSTGEDSIGCTWAWDGGNGAGTFEISLICGSEYQLTTWDTYGDGWNGGGMTITNQDGDVLLCASNSDNDSGCLQSTNFTASCSNGSYENTGLCEEVFNIEVTQGAYPDEIAWRIVNAETFYTVFNIGSSASACSGSLTGGNGSGNFEIQLQCGVQYLLQTWDTYGDGWNGGELTITNDNQEVILCTTNSSPDGCFENVYFQAQCASWISCSDPNACNFNPDATSSISCIYDCYGCTDPSASNYDENATIDPSEFGFNTCVYCDGDNWFPIEIQIKVDSCDLVGSLDEIEVSFLSGLNMDSISQFQSFTPSPLVTEFHGCATHGCQLVNSNIEQQLINQTLLIITNQHDSAYWNPHFSFNNQSLCFDQEGCTDPEAENYHSWHTVNDNNCLYEKIQLTLPINKYYLSPSPSWGLISPSAGLIESGSVLMFDEPDGTFHIPLPDSGSFRVRLLEVAVWDLSCSSWYLENEDGEIFDQTPGGNWEGGGYSSGYNYSNWFYLGPGCTDPSAPNYHWGATSDDGSCHSGCTDPSACNFAEWATTDDGSCAYESFQLDVIQGAENHYFWWTLSGNGEFRTFYNNQYNGFPCEQQQMEFNECYHSGCYTFNCSHGSNGVSITHFGNTLHEIQPLQSDFEWNNQAEICLRRPLTICNVSINESNQCVIQWDPADAAPITLNVGVYKLSGTTSEYELIGVVPIEEGSFIDIESAADINPQSYRIARRIINEGESELSDDHKTMHLSANLGVNDNVNLWWNNYEGATYANFQLQRLQPGASDWETFAIVANSTNSYTDNSPLSAQSDYRVVVELPSCEPNSNLVETASNVVSLSAAGIDVNHLYPEARLVQNNQSLRLTTSSKGPVVVELYNSLGQMIWSGALHNGEILPVRSSPQSMILASYFVEGVAIGSQKIILN